eukprot:gene4038-biopygen14404
MTFFYYTKDGMDSVSACTSLAASVGAIATTYEQGISRCSVRTEQGVGLPQIQGGWDIECPSGTCCGGCGASGTPVAWTGALNYECCAVVSTAAPTLLRPGYS